MAEICESKAFSWEVTRSRLLNRDWASPIITIGNENVSKWIVFQDPKAEDFQVRLMVKNIAFRRIPINLEISLSIWDECMKRVCNKTKAIKGVPIEGKEIFVCNYALHAREPINNTHNYLFILCEFKDLDGRSDREQMLNLVCPCINDYQFFKTNETTYANFLNDPIFSDVEMVVGEKRYPAHKLVLVANSPVFYRMFSHPMKESISKEVEIEEMSSEIFEALLEYMYRRKVSKLRDLVEELLAAANRYEMEELKLMCEHEMVRKLSLETVMEFLIIANKHEAASLKKHCLSFFVRNFNRCTALDDFVDLGKTHPDILVDLCREVAVKCKIEFKDKNY